jgi:hypothetical protein
MASPEGFQKYVEAERAAQANAPDAAALNARMARNLEIRDRANSAEVSALNDRAHMNLYGTNGRIDGFVGVDGKPLKSPIPGRINDILNSPRFPKTPEGQRQAKAAAAEFEKRITDLQEEGFELCQVELIINQVDKWESVNAKHQRQQNTENKKYDRESQRRIDLITEQNIKNGDDPDEARTKAEIRVAGHKGLKPGKPDTEKVDVKAETSRLKGLIKSEGIFTKDELEAALDEDGTRVMTPADRRKLDEKARTQRELRVRTRRLEDARIEYARLSAGRGDGLGVRGKYSQEKIDEAWEKLSALAKEHISLEVRMAQDAGVSLEDLAKYSEFFAVGEAERISNHRMVAKGRHEFVSGNSREVQEVQPTSRMGKAMDKFYGFWRKRHNAKFLSRATAEKGAAMVALGIPVGVAAGLTGSILLGPLAAGAAGAFVATRIAKSVMANHIHKNAAIGSNPEEMRTSIAVEAIRRGGAPEDQIEHIGDIVDEQADAEVKRNRMRVGGAAVSAALGGLIGTGFDHLIGIAGGGGGHDVNNGGGSHEANGGGAGDGSTGGGNSTPEAGSNGTGGSTPDSNTGNGTGGAKANVDTPAGSNPDTSAANSGKGVDLTLKDSHGNGNDSIWHELDQYSQEHYGGASDGDVNEAALEELRKLGMTPEQARHLPVGFKFHVPQSVLDQLNNKS